MPVIHIKRVQPDFNFEATDEAGNKVAFDNVTAGNSPSGISPMQSLLMAMGCCSGIDVVSIIKKQRQELHDLSMEISGTREQGKEPSLWIKAHIVYNLSGNLDEEKTRHAITLSIDKYCSVAETLRRAGCEITWEMHIKKM